MASLARWLWFTLWLRASVYGRILKKSSCVGRAGAEKPRIFLLKSPARSVCVSVWRIRHPTAGIVLIYFLFCCRCSFLLLRWQQINLNRMTVPEIFIGKRVGSKSIIDFLLATVSYCTSRRQSHQFIILFRFCLLIDITFISKTIAVGR